MSSQLNLFASPRPLETRADAAFSSVQRLELGEGAWLDFVPGWLAGSELLYARLHAQAPWRLEERQMYEKLVAVPRMIASLDPDARQATPLDPSIAALRGLLDARYGTSFRRTSAALYRDGNDSVAWHGDHLARRMETALVATISLGGARRFLVRKTGGGAASVKLSLRSGDLVVMGGTCQRTHQHSVPKTARVEPRIALMYRPVWREQDAIY